MTHITEIAEATVGPGGGERLALVAGNRLVSGPVQPVVVPLWLGAERPGVDEGAAELDAALRVRWQDRDFPELLARLAPAREVTVAVPPGAEGRLHRRDLAFLPVVADACGELADLTAAAIGDGVLALSLGGDHALSAGSIAGAARAASGGRLGVIWIDTHPDLNTPETTPSGHLHGMPLAAALGLGGDAIAPLNRLGPVLDPADSCLLGVRDVDPGERALIRAAGIWALSMDAWSDVGIVAGLEAALAHLRARGVSAVHVSFDVDVLDPLVLPGAGTTAPGGLTYREASQVVRRLRAWDGPIHSLDWVELNPTLDPGGGSTEIATALLATALGEEMI
jgi:arginase